MKKFLTLLLISALVLVGCNRLNDDTDDESDDTTDTEDNNDVDDEEEEEEYQLEGKNDLYVKDQKPGNTIEVQQYILENPGFIVIHKDEDGQAVGEIIGQSALLPAGEGKNLTITLVRNAVDGDKFIAMIHRDNNGDGKFDPAKELPVRDGGDESIAAVFEIEKD